MTDYNKVDQLIQDDKLWKAREILQGHLAQSGYDIVLFEKLGSLLLKMQDDLEAGKFLFLSGVRKNEYDHAIDLYINRHTKKKKTSLLTSLPRAVQRSKITDFPDQVIEDYAALNYTKSQLVHWLDHRQEMTNHYQYDKSKSLNNIQFNIILGIVMLAMGAVTLSCIIWLISLF